MTANIPAAKLYLVALSGGADSVALLRHIYATAQGRVAACHVNHMIRGDEAQRDESFCAALCARLDVPLEIYRIDVPALAAESGRGIEETARDARYAALTQEAQRIGAAVILTGHNADDFTETVLFNLTRGAGPAGLCGIPPMRQMCDGVTVHRPLLGVSRAEIEQYLADIGQDFVTDSTNSDTCYSRNLIRAQVIPALRRINPALDTAVARTAALIGEQEDALDTLVLPTDELSVLRTLPGAILSRAVRRLYAEASQRLYGTAAVLPYDATGMVMKMITDGKARDRISLPGKIYGAVMKGRLVFGADSREKKRRGH